jgi:hypothetical protein
LLAAFCTRMLGIFLLLVIFSLSNTAAAQNPNDFVSIKEKQKVVMVLVDYLSLEDLASKEMTTVHRMMREGGLGLMNANTAGGRVRAHSLVTIGAGRVALGSDDVGLALLPGEMYQHQTGGDVYRRRTGDEAPEGTDLLHLDIPTLRRTFDGNRSIGVPGLLGEALHQGGFTTAYIGGADRKKNDSLEYRRHGATVVMDRRGRVDFALVGEELLEIKEKGIFTEGDDYDALGIALSKALTQADFIVVETGDTIRLMEEETRVGEEVFEENKKNVLKELDLFLAEMLTRVEHYNTLVLVVTPTPSRTMIKEKNLVTPLILWQKDGATGFLASGTTRREGIVANTDIAPTVLDFFHLPVPEGMHGRKMTILPTLETNKSASLIRLNEEMIFINRYRSPLVKGYVLGQIILVVGAVGTLFINHGLGITRKETEKSTALSMHALIKVALLALSAVPLTLLIMGAYPGPSLGVFITLIMVCILILTVLALKIGGIHPLAPFCFLFSLTAGAILLDILWGAPLMQRSILGYDAMGGARYYGIGNEFMGVWLGAAMIAMASLIEISRSKKKTIIFASVFFASIIFFLASPRLGTNAGGSVAALVGFGIMMYLLNFKEISPKVFLLLGGILLTGLLSFALWDAGQSVSLQSHFGRTINALKTNGIAEAYDIIVRKGAMNLKLIRWTIWSRVFLVILAATVLFFYWPLGVMKKAMTQYPFLAKGFWGVVSGCITALIFNDSGIVAAATMSIFMAAPLIFIVIEGQEQDW